MILCFFLPLDLCRVLLTAARTTASRTGAGASAGTTAARATAAATRVSTVIFVASADVQGIAVAVYVDIVTVSVQKSATAAVGNVAIKKKNLKNKE